MSKREYPRITTPRGVLIFPHITKPDTKYVKPDGEYHTKFALPAEESSTQAFIKRLEEVLQKYIDENPDDLKPAVLKKAGRDDLYEEELDDEGEETGRLIFKFKLKAVVETKDKRWEQCPRLFDAKAQPIEEEINPWTGTEGKCSLELFPYFMQNTKNFGISMRLKAVQILELKSGSGPGAGDFGFGAEEDGYTSDSSGSAHGFDEDAGSDADDEEDF